MLALVASAFLPHFASAQDADYPPGTECANEPTIAKRLLCGRVELRRGDPAAKQNAPAPPYDGYSPDPDSAQPPPNNSPTMPTLTPATNPPAGGSATTQPE
jgi:hypothetical protein